MTRDYDRTIKIYHSCEPPGAPVLLRFKAGTHKLYHPSLDPHVSAPLVWIPKRKGAAELVRRCEKGGCEVCAATEDVGDLTLEVAMAHGIRGVPIKPSPRARTVGERVADGEVRGAWMFGRGVLGVEEGGAGVMRVADWERFGGGDGSGQVGRWLEGLPREFERWEAGPLGGSPSEGTREEGLGVEGDGRLDDGLSVDERLRDFFARRDEIQRRFAKAARSQTRALEARAGPEGEGPGVKGESQLESGLSVGERLKDFFARRDELERRFAEAARSQTRRTLEAEWRKSFKSSAAAPWQLPSLPVLNAARWDVNIANSQLAYRLQSQVTALPQGPFEVDIREYTKPITHRNRFNLATNPPLTGPPLNTETSNPLNPSLTGPHQSPIAFPFIPTGTTEANIQYYIKDLEAYMSARGFTSPRRLKPPPPPPVNTSAPTPRSDLPTSPAAHKAVDQAAAAPPPFAHTRGAAPGAGARPGVKLAQRTPDPGLAHPVYPVVSSGLSTKRAYEDAEWAAQERRKKKICRVEL
ncbi:hypothetical protein LTR35_013884 [Friedmanniomyces endolithicus]|nr:hypothetical protein LTR35_013884 [Friedmanniomyces endolithicus]KAK0273942.1 hypothetical protein LTS00_015584 [Friedmanniomyces endolithicus]KAK0987856.1 hypothetical protein LTR54_012996 [Friedmanniomyces endolithicus]